MGKAGIVPVNKRVAVEVFKPDEKTSGGLIIPEVAKDMPSDGIVAAVADDVEDFRVGDHVFFPKFEGTDVALEGKEYRLLLAEKIIARINNAPVH